MTQKGSPLFGKPRRGNKTCPKCGVSVNNLRRHLDRNRCEMQHMNAEQRKSITDAKKERGRIALNEIRKKHEVEAK